MNHRNRDFVIGNIRNICLFKSAFLFAKAPHLFESELVEPFADRFDKPTEFFNLFAGD